MKETIKVHHLQFLKDSMKGQKLESMKRTDEKDDITQSSKSMSAGWHSSSKSSSLNAKLTCQHGIGETCGAEPVALVPGSRGSRERSRTRSKTRVRSSSSRTRIGRLKTRSTWRSAQGIVSFGTD